MELDKTRSKLTEDDRQVMHRAIRLLTHVQVGMHVGSPDSMAIGLAKAALVVAYGWMWPEDEDSYSG